MPLIVAGGGGGGASWRMHMPGAGVLVDRADCCSFPCRRGAPERPGTYDQSDPVSPRRARLWARDDG
jgi:hypothetical protein